MFIILLLTILYLYIEKILLGNINNILFFIANLNILIYLYVFISVKVFYYGLAS